MDANTSSTTQQVPTGTPQASAGSQFMSFLPIVLIIVLFYFLLMRPQQKKEAKKREKISKLKNGDVIVTNGGIEGKINKVISDTELSVEISDGVVVKIYKGFIAEVLDKEANRSVEPNSEEKDLSDKKSQQPAKKKPTTGKKETLDKSK